ncbi:hypothetical protein [Halorubrum salinum]|uniref:hypothetical protein n=1 Tax=Halorubrum salinum TaxID=767517 RepID=UPI0021134851|nr:hypothetical protein [Halorubrum salinum]
MKVLFITIGNKEKASSRLRVYQHLPTLHKNGIYTKVIPASTLDSQNPTLYQKIKFAINILFDAPRYDIVYIQKQTLPIWFTRILDTISKKMIYDFDDALYESPPGTSIPEKTTLELNELLRRCDLTIAGSKSLYKYAEKYSDQVQCIHTGIPKSKYKKHQKYSDRSDNNVLLGWIGNRENIHYLSNIESEISKVLDEHGNLQLRIITADSIPVRPFKNREGKDVEYITWSLESAVEDLSAVDVGLRPLRDDKWAQSKGGFTSVVECLALGIPVAVSPVGLLQYLIDDGTNGYHVNKTGWEHVLSHIAEKPLEIEDMRKDCIDTVEKFGFWADHTGQRLLRAIKTVQQGNNGRT